MEILLNGKNQKIQNKDIFGLIRELNLSIEGLVIIHNDDVIKKYEYKNLVLNENDRVELLNFVSGG